MLDYHTHCIYRWYGNYRKSYRKKKSHKITCLENLKSKTRVVWNIFLKSKYLNLIKKSFCLKKFLYLLQEIGMLIYQLVDTPALVSLKLYVKYN